MIAVWTLIGYLVQLLACAIINVINTTRMPKSGWDFMKLTFLPWLLLHLDDVRVE
jgi:hypothetical protein